MCKSDCNCPIECSTPVALFEQIVVLTENQYKPTDGKRFFVLMYKPSASTCEDDTILKSVFNLVECDEQSLFSLGITDELKAELIGENIGFCIDVDKTISKIKLLNVSNLSKKITEYREEKCDDCWMGDDCTSTRCTDDEVLKCMIKNE